MNANYRSTTSDMTYFELHATRAVNLLPSFTVLGVTYWHIKTEDERQHVEFWTYQALYSAFTITQ